MTKRSRTALLAAGLASVAVVAAGCGGSPAGGGAGSSDGSVTTVINGDPSGFNPFLYRTTNDAILETYLYDSLLRMDADNTLVPGLASEWEAKSASSYSFTIRDGATCSDGTPITGEIVAKSLSTLADPETAAAARFLIFGPGDAKVTSEDNTVSIELSKPFSELPRGMTMAQSGIVCPAGLADMEGLNTGPVDGAYSGPYVLTSSKPGVGYELSLREDYDQWPDYTEPLEGEAPTSVNVTVSSDQSTVANKLISGDLDLGGLSDESVDRFENNPDVTVEESLLNWVYIVFNQRQGSPFRDNRALRTAVAQAVSPQSFSNAIANGRAPLLDGLADDSSDCVLHDDSLLIKPDAAAAKSALSRVDLRMIGSTSLGTDGSANVAVQEALSAAGANVDLTNTDVADWATTVTQQAQPWDFTVMGGLAPLLQSLTRIMGTPAEDGGRSITGVQVPAAEEGLAEGLAADDADARCAGFEAAQRALLEDVVAVPLVALPEFIVMRNGVSVRINNGQVDYKTLRITD